MPSISLTIVSPASGSGGVADAPTPPGAGEDQSPPQDAVAREMAIRSGTAKIRFFVDESWTTRRRSSSGASVVPVGDLVEGDEGRPERPEARRGLSEAELRGLSANWSARSDTSWPTQKPATCSSTRRPHAMGLAADHDDLLDLQSTRSEVSGTSLQGRPDSSETS